MAAEFKAEGGTNGMLDRTTCCLECTSSKKKKNTILFRPDQISMHTYKCNENAMKRKESREKIVQGGAAAWKKNLKSMVRGFQGVPSACMRLPRDITPSGAGTPTPRITLLYHRHCMRASYPLECRFKNIAYCGWLTYIKPPLLPTSDILKNKKFSARFYITKFL